MKILLALFALAVIVMASLCAYVFLDTFMVAVVFLPFGLALFSQTVSTLLYIGIFHYKDC